jgi:hypothetical protein
MSGYLQLWNYVYNYKHCIDRCYVAGGCMYSDLYRELYCVWVELCV